MFLLLNVCHIRNAPNAQTKGGMNVDTDTVPGIRYQQQNGSTWNQRGIEHCDIAAEAFIPPQFHVLSPILRSFHVHCSNPCA